MNQTPNISTALDSRPSNRLKKNLPAPGRCTDKGQEGVQNVCSGGPAEVPVSAPTLAGNNRRLRILKGLAVTTIIAILGVLFFFSLRLGATRIFQVDECVEAYVARLIASGVAKTTAVGNFGLFEVALSRLVGGAARSIEAL